MKKSGDNYIKKIVIFFLVLYAVAFTYRFFAYDKKVTVNSEKLELVTTLGDNQGYHPKVIAFDKPWNGYKYWMAFTPYPHADCTKENPVINVSNDMINWTLPSNMSAPLDIPANVDKVHYNSDTHILYNSELNRIEVFWRYVNDGDNQATIYKMTSTDGVNYTEKEVFMYSNDRKAQDYVSPAIIYENGIYRVWYVHRQKAWYTEIDKSGNMATPRVLNINYENGYKTWHLDVIYNDKYNKYEMVTVCYQDVNNRKEMPLFYIESVDNYNWSTPKMILSPATSPSAWDNQGLYRSSVLFENDTYYLFYSGHDAVYNVGVGLMCNNNIEKLKNCVKHY